jgi:hypothetical protein
MIEIKGFLDITNEPPTTERSVVVFFKDGSIIVVPDWAFNPKEKEYHEKVISYMYFPEGKMEYYIWAVVVSASVLFNKNTMASIQNEKIQDSDYVKFFEIVGIKHKIINENTLSLKAPAFSVKDIDEYVIQGKPWILGVIAYIKDNLEEFGSLLN